MDSTTINTHRTRKIILGVIGLVLSYVAAYFSDSFLVSSSAALSLASLVALYSILTVVALWLTAGIFKITGPKFFTALYFTGIIYFLGYALTLASNLLHLPLIISAILGFIFFFFVFFFVSKVFSISIMKGIGLIIVSGLIAGIIAIIIEFSFLSSFIGGVTKLSQQINPSSCGQMPISTQTLCYQTVAQNTGDVSYCDKITQTYAAGLEDPKEACYNLVYANQADKSGDPSTCNKISPNEAGVTMVVTQEGCYDQAVITSGNFALCKNAYNPQDCYMGFLQSINPNKYPAQFASYLQQICPLIVNQNGVNYKWQVGCCNSAGTDCK